MSEDENEPSTQARPRRGMRRALLGTLLAIVGAALGLELELRRTDRPPSPLPPVRHPGLPRLRDSLDLATPKIRGNFRHAFHRTDRFGFRGRDYTRSRGAASIRILVAGDSVAMGAGVEEEQTYALRLQARLREHPDRPPTEVINAGLGGGDIAHAVERLRGAMNLYGGDILVYGFTLDDIKLRAYQDPPEKEKKPAHWKHLEESRIHVLRILPAARRWLLDRWDPAARDRGHWLFWNYFRNPAVWREFEQVLDRLAAYAETRDGCGVVLTHTALEELGPFHRFGPIYERVSQASRSRGLEVANSFEEFWGRRSLQLRRGTFDPHPNPQGHDLLAKSLANAVLRLPDRCWDTGRPRTWAEIPPEPRDDPVVLPDAPIEAPAS
jgi:hypothetical protein